MSLGLALAGGGIKGAAHIGVLKALEENNIKIDYIGGTSSGSIVAALYALGYTPDEIYDIFKDYAKKIKCVTISNILKLLFGFITTGKIVIDGLNSGKEISKLINKFSEQKMIYNISELKMPLVIPSVDMHNGEVICFTSENIKRDFSDNTVYINDIDIGKAVQASCSFPSVFSPCNFENRKLIDGGVRENVPWREIKELGADKVLSITFENKVDKECCKNLIEVADRSFELICRELSKYELSGADYILKIKTEKVSLLDRHKIDEMYQKGYKDAIRYIRKVQKQEAKI